MCRGHFSAAARPGLEHLETPRRPHWEPRALPGNLCSFGRRVWETWDAYHKGLWELMNKHLVPEKLYPNYGRLHTTAMKFAMQLATIDWSMLEARAQST